MSIEELEMLLYDMYEMDICMPPLFREWRDEFDNLSYSVWAVHELKTYIVKRISPRTYGSVDEFCEITKEFIIKTAKYKKINPMTREIFSTATDMAIAVLELLEAMK